MGTGLSDDMKSDGVNGIEEDGVRRFTGKASSEPNGEDTIRRHVWTAGNGISPRKGRTRMHHYSMHHGLAKP